MNNLISISGTVQTKFINMFKDTKEENKGFCWFYFFLMLKQNKPNQTKPNQGILMSKIVKTHTSDDAYQESLSEIINMINDHRTHAVQAVQTISNNLYWNIGDLIIKRQHQHGWGKSIVEQLSKDMIHQIGSGVSWSPRNLWFMRQLVAEYSNLKQAVSEVPWGHNILILQKVKDLKARVFYLQTTIKNRYSRAVLLHQIEADAYRNYLLNPSQHNFAAVLPENLLEQTQESIKSVY